MTAAAILTRLDGLLDRIFMPPKSGTMVEVAATGPEVRMIYQRRVFTGTKPFEAMFIAERWCAARGISVGAACRNEPRGLMRGEFDIAKWKNLTPHEREAMDGTMRSNDFRHGPVIVSVISDGALPD